MTETEFLKPLEIPDNDIVYRQVHKTHLKSEDSKKPTRFPKESHFKPDSDGLSVNWNQFTNVNGVYHVIGLTYRMGTDKFKNPSDFAVFQLPVSFVRSLEQVTGVVHSPVFNGDPAAIGKPNNYAHTSLLFPDDEEVRIKLSDYCRKNHESCYCSVDYELIETEITILRDRMDNTHYHRLAKPSLESEPIEAG